MPEQHNVTEIRRYLEKDGPPMKDGEFREFWMSLTEEEKNEYKTTPLE